MAEDDFQSTVINQLNDMGITTLDTSVNKSADSEFEYSFYLEMPENISEENLVRHFPYKCSLNFTH